MSRHYNPKRKDTDMDPEIEQKMKAEHFAKYAGLAEQIGLAKLRPLIPRKPKTLADWDAAVGFYENPRTGACTYFNPPPIPEFQGLSAAERVCLLKHVAEYHKPVLAPQSRCFADDQPCTPGADCQYQPGVLCSVDCGDYISYNEDDPRADR